MIRKPRAFNSPAAAAQTQAEHPTGRSGQVVDGFVVIDLTPNGFNFYTEWHHSRREAERAIVGYPDAQIVEVTYTRNKGPRTVWPDTHTSLNGRTVERTDEDKAAIAALHATHDQQETGDCLVWGCHGRPLNVALIT